MAIEKLSSEIINQIAAGEVIENPAAVIKELVENSIDAKAKNIEIEIVNSGFDKIIVKDDGCGIPKSDLVKAPQRHATSKIKSFDDLYKINSMGFRGEALASIFSIAKTKIISKIGDANAFEINSENQDEVRESAGANGTCIYVEDIFYNTPARKKYLKSGNVELKAILDIFERFEIFNHNMKFVLRHNGKLLVNKPAFDSVENNLIYVLGRELKGNLFEINSEIEGIKIKGFIGKPSNLTYSFRKNQYLFVNGRFIKSKLITNAVYDGFGSNLMTNRHPFFVLFIEIDPEIIDVNVHPTKIEIKFEDEETIHRAIKETVENVFEKQESFKDFEIPKVEEYDTSLSEKIDEIISAPKKEIVELEKSSKYYSSESQSHFDVKEDEVIFEKSKRNDDVGIRETQEDIAEGPLFETLKEYKILGQLNKTYIIVQTPNEMLLIDQHVAEEKYYYEKFKNDFELNSKTKTQMLLKPEIIHLSNSEMLSYKENYKILQTLGFESEEFGNNEIIVRGVPITIRNEVVQAKNLRDMLYNILINKKIKCVEEENYSKLASMACRISIMAGDELTMPQMKRIVENLKTLKQPFNCPHGRPTFLRYSYYELDKRFKRVV